MSRRLDVIRPSLESIRSSAGDTTYSRKVEGIHVESLIVNIHLSPRNGHAYAVAYNNNDGYQNLGDVLGPIMSGNRARGDRRPEVNTPPISIKASEINDDDEQWRTRKPDWFRVGRIFRISAPADKEKNEPGDHELDKKVFVLLDSKNSEGPGLLVDFYDDNDEELGGFFNKSHVHIDDHPTKHIQDETNKQGKKTVYLDEWCKNKPIPKNSYIELEHQYNIPFTKYRCIDYGVLSPASVTAMRKFYIQCLISNWELEPSDFT